MSSLLIALTVALMIVALTGVGVRIARRYRRLSLAAASLLLIFGMNFKIDPPPPPRLEAVSEDEEEEEATDVEPK